MTLEEAKIKLNEIKKEYATMDGLKEYVEAIDMIDTEINKLNNVIDRMAEKIYKLKIKLEINDLLQDFFIPREFSDINDCIKKDCKECLKEYFMKE